jgi:hypothetical protein
VQRKKNAEEKTGGSLNITGLFKAKAIGDTPGVSIAIASTPQSLPTCASTARKSVSNHFNPKNVSRSL